MANNQQRLFVGNLPPNIREEDLQHEFSCYGSITKIEVKHKKSPDSDEIRSSFAFVTLSIDDRTLQKCLHEFKQEQYRGRYLQVTVARENFLEKLKREREEGTKNVSQHSVKTKDTTTKMVKASFPTFAFRKSTNELPSSESSSSDEDSDDEKVKKNIVNKKPSSTNKQNGSKKTISTPNSSSELKSDDSDVDMDNLVLRKKSKIFVENGKIKIDHNVPRGEAIHVIDITNNKSSRKELDQKSKKADQKRVESMQKMKNLYNEQKLAIKNALTDMDTSKANNKILFGDEDDDELNVSTQKSNQTIAKACKPEKFPTNAKKPKLFNDDEYGYDDGGNVEDYKNDFQIKEQFQGKKGEKLLQLQNRFQNDRRFNMSSKFMDKDDEPDDYQAHLTGKSKEILNENDDDDERQWQYDILESVMGKKIRIDAPPRETKKKAPPSMLRFDPTRAEHTKFIETVKKRPKVRRGEDVVPTKRSKVSEQPEENVLPPVSMEQFFEIRGDLKTSLGSGGFSLLSMFNRAPEHNHQNSSLAADKPYVEKSVGGNRVKFMADLDPFKYDSSGDEANDIGGNGSTKAVAVTAAVMSSKDARIQHETFFILRSNDERIAEGIAFFTSDENLNGNPDNYDDAQRQELKNIVKRKIKKSVQNALPRHAKPNKRFTKFTKNL